MPGLRSSGDTAGGHIKTKANECCRPAQCRVCMRGRNSSPRPSGLQKVQVMAPLSSVSLFPVLSHFTGGNRGSQVEYLQEMTQMVMLWAHGAFDACGRQTRGSGGQPSRHTHLPFP